MGKFDDIPNGCIPEQIDCLVTRGLESERLEITDGSGLNATLGKIIQDLDNRSTGSKESTEAEQVTGANPSVTSTVESFKKKTRLGTPITVTSKAVGGSVALSYNFGAALSELQCTSSQTNVTVISSEGNRVYNSKSSTGSASLTAEHYPVILSVEISCFDNGKETRISYKKQIRETTSTYNEYVNAESMASINIGSQEDRNSYYDQNIADLRYRLESTENIKFNGAVDLNDAIACTRMELDELASKQNAVDTTCDGKTLCEAFTSIETLETKMEVLLEEIQRLQTLVNNVSKTA